MGGRDVSGGTPLPSLYGSILIDYVRKNMCKIDHRGFLSVLAKNIVIKGGKQMFMDFKGAFSTINERKEGKHIFWEPN